MTYSFRFRCVLNDYARIAVSEARLVLREDGAVIVYISNEGDGPGPLTEADVLTIRGRGYDSLPSAREGCVEWVRNVNVGFAGAGIGADFSLREPFEESPVEPREVVNEQGERHMADDGEPIVYRTEPKPIFSRALPVGRRKGVHGSRLLEEIDFVAGRQVDFGAGLRIAYDLYSAAQGLTQPDAQLVMYVSAIEALIERPTRGSRAVDLIESLRAMTKASNLDGSERNSILSQMRDLRYKSIKATGRGLTRQLALSFEGQTSEQLFARSYDVRSLIVHGSEDRPPVEEVAGLASRLDLMVGRLIATVAVGREYHG